MARLFWICLAGALGTGSRFLISQWASARFGGDFPYGTLIVNLLGCFLIAFITTLALGLSWFSPDLRLALTTGFIGGLTTYSAFNLETTLLIQEGALASALINIGATTLGGFLAGLGGVLLGRMLIAP